MLSKAANHKFLVKLLETKKERKFSFWKNWKHCEGEYVQSRAEACFERSSCCHFAQESMVNEERQSVFFCLTGWHASHLCFLLIPAVTQRDQCCLLSISWCKVGKKRLNRLDVDIQLLVDLLQLILHSPFCNAVPRSYRFCDHVSR